MNRITCDYCGNILTFTESEDRPAVCPECNSPLQSSRIENHDTDIPGEDRTQIDTAVTGTPGGLTLVYQTTGEKIDIPHSETIVIGRTSAGGELLSRLPQISREHCRIEYRDGNYFVTDSGSLNGTYLGSSKIDCGSNPGQVIEDYTLLYLGREPFLIRLRHDQTEKPITAEPESEAQRYRCSRCGVEFDTREDICSNCGSYDSMETI